MQLSQKNIFLKNKARENIISEKSNNNINRNVNECPWGTGHSLRVLNINFL